MSQRNRDDDNRHRPAKRQRSEEPELPNNWEDRQDDSRRHASTGRQRPVPQQQNSRDSRPRSDDRYAGDQRGLDDMRSPQIPPSSPHEDMSLKSQGGAGSRAQQDRFRHPSEDQQFNRGQFADRGQGRGRFGDSGRGRGFPDAGRGHADNNRGFLEAGRGRFGGEGGRGFSERGRRFGGAGGSGRHGGDVSGGRGRGSFGDAFRGRGGNSAGFQGRGGGGRFGNGRGRGPEGRGEGPPPPLIPSMNGHVGGMAPGPAWQGHPGAAAGGGPQGPGMQANQWRGPMLDPTAPPPPPPVRIPPLNAAAVLLNARRKESSEAAFIKQIVGLEVSPALAGADVIEQWMKRLPDGAAAAATKESSSRRSAQLSQCYISTVLLPGEGQTPVLSATADNQKAFVDLVQLFHVHPEARSGTYGMFLLTGEQHASGYL